MSLADWDPGEDIRRSVLRPLANRVNAESSGIWCCGDLREWKDMTSEIIPDGDGGLLWRWLCNVCGNHLRTDPFNPPGIPGPNEWNR